MTSPITVKHLWLPFSEQAPLFNALDAGPWHRASIRGKQIRRKNIVFYEGDADTAQEYARAATDKEPPIPYADGPSELQVVRNRLQAEYGYSFSACYINYYADESVGIGWHNDAEEIGSEIPVRMLCLGGSRTFSVWKVRRGGDGKLQKPFAEWEELTESGDLVEMPVGFHEKGAYRHAVLPQKSYAAARISLTFRSPDLSECSFSAVRVTAGEITGRSTKNQFAGPRVWCCKAGKTYPTDAVYVGCKTVRGQVRDGSIFGNAVNPLKMRNKNSNPLVATDAASFREYAEQKMKGDTVKHADFREHLKWLRGKHLLCWCEQDGPNKAAFCHARIWLELANRPDYYWDYSPTQALYGLESRRQKPTDEHFPTTDLIEGEF